MTINTIKPQEARQAVAAGARFVDIRDPDEHAREHIAGSLNVPLAQLGAMQPLAGPLVFHCRSGMRTQANAAALKAAAQGCECHILEGGIDAWRAAGLPTERDSRQPIEIMRQVQIAAGSLILAGVLLGFGISPLFFGLSAFVGAGLMLAGITGWCGMAQLLRIMPWNRRA